LNPKRFDLISGGLVFLKNSFVFLSSQDESVPSAGEEPAPEQAASAKGDANPEAELAAARVELEAAQQKLAETHERMLRIAADSENSRKRWERERQEVRQYSITEFARDLLPVIDAFDKAMAAVDSAGLNPETEEGKRMLAVVEGVQLVSKMFYDANKKHGIERLPGAGEPFNPQYHNAVARVVDASVERDTVLDEFVPGYKIGDRVLRTAMVRVAVKE
jgi:molecular chaperone GrpE